MNLDFSVIYESIRGGQVEIYDDASVVIDIPCSCQGYTTLYLDADELIKLGEKAKLFKERRITWKAKHIPE